MKLVYKNKCEVKYYQLKVKVRKSHLPSPAVDSVLVVDRLFMHTCMNVLLQSKQWLCICIKNIYIAKMLIGVVFFNRLNLLVKIH